MFLSTLALQFPSVDSPFTAITLVCFVVLVALIVIEAISLASEKKLLPRYKFLAKINLISCIAPVSFIYIISRLNIPQEKFNAKMFYLIWLAIPLVIAGIEFFIYQKKLKEIRFKKLLGLLLFINISSYLLTSFWLISAPLYLRERRPSPRIACTSNLKQIGLSLKQYAMDYDDWFPDKSGPLGFEKLRSIGYLTEHRVYSCPSCKGPRVEGNQKLNNKIVDYVYRSGLRENDDFDKAKTPLAWDRPTNHENYGNVLFLDGHVTGFPGVDWMEQAGIKKTANHKGK